MEGVISKLTDLHNKEKNNNLFLALQTKICLALVLLACAFIKVSYEYMKSFTRNCKEFFMKLLVFIIKC